ncbi:MAG: enoyl-CoA hydratase-related protein [Elusimicrobiota bacterium]
MEEAATQDVLSRTEGAVGIVQINRPKVLNALSYSVIEDIGAALEAFDRDDSIRCMVLMGSEKAFAAGADIKELEGETSVDMVLSGRMLGWDRLRRLAKPVIAAVSGFALGGGCELAMSCDIIVASESAVFGQPEVDIGVIPGAGGTQRLTRALGKSLAMDMVLTGRRIDAETALRHGLVSRVFPVETCLEDAVALAKKIAEKPPVAVRLAKDGVSRALDMSLETALEYERKLFYLVFGTADQKEGMRAFREKRKPEYRGR